jgi:putative ABC transport system permease protein
VAALPTLANPSGSLIATSTGAAPGVIVSTTVFALAAAVATTAVPIVRALRTDTVAALADTVHRPPRRVRLSRLSERLPIALLLSLRLIGRRPGRAFLQAISTSAIVTVGVVLLMVYAQPPQRWNFGAITLTDFTDGQNRHLLLTVTTALITLALVNTVTLTWTTALEARAVMAIVRTLGATAGQVTASLSLAQLLPTVPGALAGVPIGLLVYLPFDHDVTTTAPLGWFVAVVLVPLVATAALSALPARAAARASIAATLSAETA